MFNKDLKQRMSMLEFQFGSVLRATTELMEALEEAEEEDERVDLRISPRTGKPVREYLKRKA